MKKTPKYLAEAVGTFCLVFAGTGAVVVDEVAGGRVTGLGIGMVFGLVVLAMIYTFGHVSGAHFNPSVTLGFYAAGRFPADELLPYIAAQFLGAVAASGLLRLMFRGRATSFGVTLPVESWGQAFVMEFVLTAILMLVISAVATDSRAEGTMAGVAVGATVCLAAIMGGPISGASMNPARSFGPALVSGHFAHHWIYWGAPLLGGVAGARIYALIRCQGAENESKPGCR